MKLSEKIQEALREQQEINLSDPAVQKQLAAQWGYVPAGAQPAQSIKDAIIDDLQSQFDSDGITEHDSGDALIRLSDAIAAVEDNFAQPAPSIPEISDDLIEVIESRAEQSYRRHHGGLRGQQVTPADALSWHIIHTTRDVLATAAPEAKP